jgi:hypothetical protein
MPAWFSLKNIVSKWLERYEKDDLSFRDVAFASKAPIEVWAGLGAFFDLALPSAQNFASKLSLFHTKLDSICSSLTGPSENPIPLQELLQEGYNCKNALLEKLTSEYCFVFSGEVHNRGNK